MEIRGTITRVFFSSPTFTAGQIRVAGDKFDRSFAGKCCVRIGEAVLFRGEYKEHEKYGHQFSVEEVGYDANLDTDGLVTWLAMTAAGIGQTRAKQIVDHFGDQFEDAILNRKEEVAQVGKIPLATVERLADQWNDRREFNAIASQLAAYELSQHEIKTLVEKFGGSIIGMLKDDPYCLMFEVPGFGFQRIDKIAQKLGTSKSHPGRIAAGIGYAMVQAYDKGSTCQVRERLMDVAEEILAPDDPTCRALIHDSIDGTDGCLRKVERIEAIDGTKLMALPFPHRCESYVAGILQRNCRNRLWPTDAAVEATARTHCAGLNDESQERAVRMALANRFCVISGAAGSGKTTIIERVVLAYQNAGLSVALAAPTGKAARRLSSVANCEASTIHRLLAYNPKLGWQINERNPLGCDVVIVDETSMMDCELAYRLFGGACRSSVVLVGDHHQLPPVGAGALLRDCIQKNLVPVTILEKCHRQAGILKHNCNEILAGKVPSSSEKEKDSAGREYAPWIVHDQLDKDEAILACIERLHGEVLSGRYGFKVPWDVQFMTAIHKGSVGTRSINLLLQRLHQSTLGVAVAPQEPEKPPKLYIGDKVIQTKNNYELEVMNGHQGRVIETDPQLIVEFENRTVVVPNDCRGEVELGYCLTPHKMQGSEVPVAVVIVSSSHRFMCHRSWAYTACTRAKNCCIVLGDRWSIRRAAERVVIDDRVTLLPVLMEAHEGVASN